MKLRRLQVENFRGIRSADWAITSNVIALIGAGDVGKSTLLSAIELVLSPRWNPPLSDDDFRNLDAETPVRVEATVGALPTALCSDGKFGLDLRGLSPDGLLNDEPDDEDELVLTIRFELDASLEPRWAVVNDRLPEGRPIGARDRAALGMVRLGSNTDRHLGWRRGSALERMTHGGDETSRVLADAQRQMREAINSAPLDELDEVVEQARLASTQMGAGPVSESLRPALEASEASKARALSLHADQIPLSRSGLGTKRLVAMALERLVVPTGAIMLVDELEAGLEPFRLRHLLSVLRRLVDGDGSGQVLFTTHSPVAIAELEPTELHVVVPGDGDVEVRPAPIILRPQLRSTPEAFLARKLVVCEGKTEIGMCLAVADSWATRHDSQPLAHTGTALALGQGSETASRAMGLAAMGYATMVLADSDRDLEPGAEELERAGVEVVQWADGVATETRVMRDLPLEGVQELLDVAILERGEQSVLAAVQARLTATATPVGVDLRTWVEQGIEEAGIKSAVAEAAGKGQWFKRVDLGRRLGEVLIAQEDALQGTDTSVKLERVRRWVYGE